MTSILQVFITLVRHGETDYNLRKLTQGQLDVPLNDVGRNQATLAGIALQNLTFNDIYSSDLSRAFETAEVIVKQNVLIKQPFPITADTLLRETCHGVFQNKPSSELKEAAIKAGFVEPFLR